MPDEESGQKILIAHVLFSTRALFSHLRLLGNHPISLCHALKSSQSLVRQAGLPLHSLRHTHATFLLQAGIHPCVAMERLGHSSIRVTLDTYSHVIGGLQEAVAQRFDDFISAKGTPMENIGKMSSDRAEETSDITKLESG